MVTETRSYSTLYGDSVPMPKDVVKQPENSNVGGITGKGWKPGQSGNPAGRPKKISTWSEQAKELLQASEIDIGIKLPDGNKKRLKLKVEDGKTILHAVIGSLILEALNGNIPAMRELADRTEGKPAQKLEVETNELPQGFVTRRI